MIIRRNIAFKLRAYGKDGNIFQIRLRTTFNGQRFDIKTGCQIHDKDFWDDGAGLVKDGYIGPKGESTLSINNELRNVKDQMDTSFKYFEAMDQIPSMEQLKKKFEERIKGVVPRKLDEKRVQKPKEMVSSRLLTCLWLNVERRMHGLLRHFRSGQRCGRIL